MSDALTGDAFFMPIRERFNNNPMAYKIQVNNDPQAIKEAKKCFRFLGFATHEPVIWEDVNYLYAIDGEVDHGENPYWFERMDLPEVTLEQLKQITTNAINKEVCHS